jgi:ABC-type multidrug transport system fused ATPase/permease subunit
VSERDNENRIAPAQPRKQEPRRGPGPGGGPPWMRGGNEKPKDLKKSLKKLFGFLAPFKWKIIFVILLSNISTVLSQFVPKITAEITNELARVIGLRASGIHELINYSLINRTLMILLGFYLLSVLFAYFQGFTMTSVTTTITYNFRNAIMQKINKLPVGFFHSMTHGEVMSRITNDVETLSQNLTQTIMQAVNTVITLVMVLVLMLTMSWKLTLIAVLMIPGSALVTLFMVKVSQKYFRKQQSLLGTVNGTVEEVLSGHTVVKAFNAEGRIMREFDVHNDELYNTAWKAQFLTGFMMPMMNFIGNLGYVAVCMVGAMMVTNGTDGLNVGDIQAFITYIRSFTQPITQLANISSQLQSTAAAAERVFDFLDEPEETDVDTKYNIDSDPIVGDVTFEHVKFAYEYIEKDEDEEGPEAMFKKMQEEMEAREQAKLDKKASKGKKGAAGPGGGFPGDGNMPKGGFPGGGRMPRGGFPGARMSGGGMPGGGMPGGGGFPGGGGGMPRGGFPGMPGGKKDVKKLGSDEDALPKKKKSGEPVIKDFSAHVSAGQKVAIVGPTGAGKTTMVKLLMRFHDLNGGAILVDGKNIANYTRRDLRREFGMVLQDTWLYNGTIMENIRYGRPDATDEEVIAAAKAAQVDHFVRTLPESYGMMLNEETTNISQGQKQLLTIARAILADSRILILDEATSSVDTRTEILIQRAMDNLLEGRTSFIIAHRLSTIRNADLILCMKDGDIVEQGTHEQLLAQNGFYADLYNSQFEDVGNAS